MKCQVCGKDLSLPFRCSYCQGYFCIDHKLPENHTCPDLPKEKFWYRKEKTTDEHVPKAEREAAMFGIEEPEPKHFAEPEKHRSKKSMIVGFCVILIVVGAIVAYTSYSFGYNMGSDVSSDLGYEEGYDRGYVDGNLSGYNLGRSKGYNEGYVDGNESGYQEGYDSGYIQGVADGVGRGYNIRDPTYQEAVQFITSDQTDENEYNEDSYNCHHFTADFKNNAFEAEYRCGYVAIEFPEFGHAIVCFDTIDQGIIYIEPQTDELVTLTIGEPYWDRTIYEPPTYDDTVIAFMIIW